MDLEVFLSPEALSDLERIVAYIALENAAAAEKMGISCSTPPCP